MSSPPSFDRYTPEFWTNTHNHTTKAAQNVPGLLTYPSNLASNSTNPLVLDHAAALSPGSLNPGHLGAAADPESYQGGLSWLSDGTPFGQTSNEHDGATAHRHSNLYHQHSIDVVPLHSNTGSTAQSSGIPTPRPSGSSRGRTARPEACRSVAATNTGPAKCEWKGCTYPGVFSRRIELKRHVETKHIFPRSYECPEQGCKKLFNREDNLRQHLHRIH